MQQKQYLIPCTKVRDNAIIPYRASEGAVGYDVSASALLDRETREVIERGLPCTLLPEELALIGSGVILAVPMPLECEVRPRSGLATKHDIELGNAPGTLDPDYRGEAGILLRNKGKRPFIIEAGMRIAQFIFKEVGLPVLEIAESLPATPRGMGGFGSTGLMQVSGGTKEGDLEQLKLDHYFMDIAFATAKLSSCRRGVTPENPVSIRKFGSVIVKNGSVIATGYNCLPKGGSGDCTSEHCAREIEGIPSGQRIERGCNHAEWVAISNLREPAVGSVIYTNAEPCIMCAKLLALYRPEAVVIPRGVYTAHGIDYLKASGIVVRYLEVK